MSFVSTRTMIPIARVAHHLGLSYWHFFGQEIPVIDPIVSSCDDDTYQFGWQSSGKLSREDVADALRQAEDIVVSHLHWTPVQQWFEEDHPITDFYRTEGQSIFNARGRAKSVKTDYGYVTEVGRRLNVFMGTPAITWKDLDGDTFKETGEITIATTVTDPTELRLYYPGKDGIDEYEIRPLSSVSIAAGTATIRFPRYLAALENLLTAFIGDDPHIIVDATKDANYLTTVDVYRVYTDTTEQGLFFYENDISCDTTPCTPTSESACLFIRDSRLGVLAYNRSDYLNGSWVAKDFLDFPDKIRIYYRAGWKDPNRQYNKVWIDQNLERLIIFFSLTLLDTKLSGCDNTRNIWQYMTENYALSTGEKRYTISFTDIDNNPLGMTRAGVLLWKYIQPKRLQGFSMP